MCQLEVPVQVRLLPQRKISLYKEVRKMRIKELAKCAREDNTLTLLDEFDDDGLLVRQYVMLPERAVFPLDGLPMMNGEQLLTMMDIPKEKQPGWNVDRAKINERLRMMLDDAKATDKKAHVGFASLTMNGETVSPVFSGVDGCTVGFVNNDLLRVLGDLKRLDVCERSVDGSRVYVLLNGMLNVGCMVPTSEHWSKRCAQELAVVGVEARRVHVNWDEEHEADG